jgi:hypothetical protein
MPFRFKEELVRLEAKAGFPPEAVAKWMLTVPIAARLSRAKAGKAQERAEHGHVAGKILLLAVSASAFVESSPVPS